MHKPPTNAPLPLTPNVPSFEKWLAGLLDWPERQKTLWPQLTILLFLAFLAFFQNLDLSFLGGTEGRYAQITREMVKSQDYVHLTKQEEPYNQKPPMFFWFLAGSRGIFGETEFAYRLPGALFALGTMAVTYALGYTLFSRTAGFWAAFVVGTTHVFLWYGRKVLIDTTLTFSMTLALFAWVRIFMYGKSPFWFVVAFLSMALGTVTKSIHAFVLPMILMVAHSLLLKDLRAFKTTGFWIGLALFGGLTYMYFSSLGNQFGWHFNFEALLSKAFDFSTADQSAKTTPFNFHWYLPMIWFDFFPWSILIPSSLLLILSQKSLRENSTGQFLLLWFLGFLLCLSVYKVKREPYLMPLVPGLALMIGQYMHQVSRGYQETPWIANLTKGMLVLLSLGFAGILFVGPFLIDRKWHTSVLFLPFLYSLPMVGLCGFLAWSVIKGKFQVALATMGIVAVGFVIGLVNIVLPIIAGPSSTKHINSEVRASATRLHQPLYQYGLRRHEDMVYYARTPPVIPIIQSESEFIGLAKKQKTILVLTEKPWLEHILKIKGVSIQILREWPQRKKDIFLLSVHPSGQTMFDGKTEKK